MMTFDVKRIYESALQYVNSPRPDESRKNQGAIRTDVLTSSKV